MNRCIKISFFCLLSQMTVLVLGQKMIKNLHIPQLWYAKWHYYAILGVGKCPYLCSRKET